jgi:MFS family permease
MKAVKLWFIRLIDVYEEECSEVFVMWFLSFIYRICMVLGWTVMVAFFVGEYGVLYLPVLFALHSFTNILGSLFFGRLINKFEKSSLTLYIAIITSFVFAINAFVYAVSPEVFLLTSLIGVSLFLSQFKIVRALFAEGIFSPTQATRLFPVIESAETIGVLLGGTLVAILSMTLSLNKIFLVMVVLMLMCVPTVLYYMDKSILVPYRQLLSIPEKNIHIEEDEIMDWGLIKKQLKNNKFVSYLFLVVLFQFIFFGILEFHFTFVVEEFSKGYHDTGGLESNLAADLGL